MAENSGIVRDKLAEYESRAARQPAMRPHNLDLPGLRAIPRDVIDFIQRFSSINTLRCCTFGVFDVIGGYLTDVPREMVQLTQIVVLDLSYNKFMEVPDVVFDMVNVKVGDDALRVG